MKRPVQWSRAALDDIKEQVRFIAQDSPVAARRIANRLQEIGVALGTRATGRPGRVRGTYEKSVPGLPYVIAYMLQEHTESENIVILRVIHTARNWPAEEWPDKP